MRTTRVISPASSPGSGRRASIFALVLALGLMPQQLHAATHDHDGRWAPWSPYGAVPEGRVFARAIYDPVRDRMIVYGGMACNVADLDGTWALALGSRPAWYNITPAGSSPGPRRGHTMIYDPLRDRMVVFGGGDGSAGNFTSPSETWALSLAEPPLWCQVPVEGVLPTGRYWHTAIYDPVRDRMIVFGGILVGGQNLNEVWALSLTGTATWTLLLPAGPAPAARAHHTAIYDPVRDRMVVFGGYSTEVWALSLAGTPTWTQLSPAGPIPEEATCPSAIYDPVRDRMVVLSSYCSFYDGCRDLVFASLSLG